MSVFWGCDEKAQCETEPGRKQLLDTMLLEYSRVHFGSLLEAPIQEGSTSRRATCCLRFTDRSSSGMLSETHCAVVTVYALERNWVGPIAKTPTAETFEKFQGIAEAMTPRNRWSWRLQQLFYRANYDMFVYTRA